MSGDLPTGWDLTTIGAVIERHFSGPSPTCEERNISNLDEWGVLKTTAITWNGWNPLAHKVLPPEYWGRSNLLVQAGDVIVTKAGPRHRCGVVANVTSVPEHVIVSGKMVGLRPNQNIVVPRILAAAVATSKAQKYLDARTTGMAESQVNFTNDDLLSTPIMLPPLPEQRRIAEILDAADEAIRWTEQVVAKLKAVKTGLLHDLLTCSLDEHGRLRDPQAHPEQFMDSPLGRIPKEWDICPLSSLADVDRGKFAHRPRNDPTFYDGEHPFIQTGDVTSAEGGILKTHSQTLNERGAAISREFPTGTIAITIAANIADTAILGRPMYFPDSIVGVVVRPPHNVRYVELCIRRAKSYLDAQAPQSAQKNINLEVLRPLLIAVPTPAEQKLIVAVYDAHDARIRAEEAELTKLRQVKRGLMDDLLTGKVRTV
jgi:type I restriction enzyme S subunit